MATTAVPIAVTISDALKKKFAKDPTLEEVWRKVNERVDALYGTVGTVDVKQQQTQAAVASGAGTKSTISPWLIVGAILLVLWIWKRK